MVVANARVHVEEGCTARATECRVAEANRHRDRGIEAAIAECEVEEEMRMPGSDCCYYYYCFPLDLEQPQRKVPGLLSQ
jgi:hypothetical protein